MKHYPHEKREQTGPANTVWPEMSTNGLDNDDVKAYLKTRGLSYDLAESNGWYPSRCANDQFLRVVIPARTTLLTHVYWQARAVSHNVHVRYQSPSGPRHGALILVRAFPDDDRCSEQVVVVEGPLDSLSVAACGYDSIALMGMRPGTEAIGHLKKLVDGRPALIVLDNEPEATRAAFDIAMQLASNGSRTNVENLRYAKDLAAMPYPARQVWLDTVLAGLR